MKTIRLVMGQLRGRDRRAGSSILVVMVIVLLVVCGTAVLFSYSGNVAFLGRKQSYYLTAKANAEAGISDAYNQLRANTNLANRTFPVTSFNGGTYQETFTTVYSNRFLLISSGTYKGASAVVSVDLNYYPQVVNPANGGYSTLYGPYVFTNSMLVGGNVDWSGCGSFSNGCRAYAGGYISMSGSANWSKSSNGTFYVSSRTKITQSGSCVIDATLIAAPVFSSSGAAKIIGTKVVGPVAKVPIPAIELSPFYAMACKNGQVYTNYSLSGSGTFTVPGGFMWVVGSANISGSRTLKGCIVTTGNISLSGNTVITPYDPGFPTLLSRDGSISMSGQANITGVIYAQTGGISWSGGGNLYNGALVCAGALSKSGNSDSIGFSMPSSGSIVIYTPNSTATTNSTSRLVITAWH